MGELLNKELLYKRVKDIVEWKNLTIVGGYGAEPVKAEDMIAYFEEYGRQLVPYICDVGVYLDKAHKAGKNIMFEAQLGALRDIDFGIYPYTSSSSTIAAYAPIGAGVPNLQLDNSIGIMKAYSTCVGEGSLYRRVFRRESGNAEKARRRVRRGDGQTEKSRTLRRRGFPLRYPLSGRQRDRAHQTRRIVGV